MAKIKTASVVGTASETGWSQGQTISYGEKSQLMIVLKLECDKSDTLIDLATIGAAMIAEIEKNGQGIGTSEILKEVVESVIVGVQEDIKVELLVGLVMGDELILYGRGDAAAYLSRNNQLAKLKDSWGEGDSLLGKIRVGDTVVVCTTKLVDCVGSRKFMQILTQDSDPAEALAPLLHKNNDSSGVAAVVATVTEQSEVVSKPRWWQRINERRNSIILRSETPRKINLWVGGVILIVLMLMIGVGMVRRVKQIREAEFNSLNVSVGAKIDETLSVGDLNPERARELLSQAKGEVESYLGGDIQDAYKERANKLLNTIVTTEERAFKKNEIRLETVVELRVLVEGMMADQMKSDGKGNLVFGDSAQSRIVSMSISDRSRQVVETASDKMIDLAVSEAKLYGLNATEVMEFSWKKDESKKIIEADEFWKEPEMIELFAGNVYILDKDQGEIWKYPTLGDTFGGRRRWFAVGIAPDLTNVVDMKVVGDIWLLTSTGKLERYSRGAPVNFLMEGFPAKGEGKKLVDPQAVWVTDSLVYVLESGAERVVVFGVDGKYRAQYTNGEFAKATDLVVVDDKGYVLLDNVVKEFGL